MLLHTDDLLSLADVSIVAKINPLGNRLLANRKVWYTSTLMHVCIASTFSILSTTSRLHGCHEFGYVFANVFSTPFLSRLIQN